MQWRKQGALRHLLEDGPRSAEIRAVTRDAHLAYLEEHRDILVLGGALLAEDGRTRIGSMLVVNVPSRKAAETFSENEPFRRAGLLVGPYYPHAPRPVESGSSIQDCRGN
jgi:uncharacterized protein YciI